MEELYARKPRITVAPAEGLALLSGVAAVLIWSGINPTDRLTWFMEVILVIAAIPLLLFTRVRFPPHAHALLADRDPLRDPGLWRQVHLCADMR